METGKRKRQPRKIVQTGFSRQDISPLVDLMINPNPAATTVPADRTTPNAALEIVGTSRADSLINSDAAHDVQPEAETHEGLLPTDQAENLEQNDAPVIPTEPPVMHSALTTPDAAPMAAHENAAPPIQQAENLEETGTQVTLTEPQTLPSTSTNTNSASTLDDKQLRIKGAAKAAYEKINKGCFFFDLLFSVMFFHWGHCSKVSALKAIMNNPETKIEDDLKKALGMHRFTFFSCCRGKARSLDQYEKQPIQNTLAS